MADQCAVSHLVAGESWCARGANVQFRDLFTFIPLFAHLFQSGTPATPDCGLF